MVTREPQRQTPRGSSFLDADPAGIGRHPTMPRPRKPTPARARRAVSAEAPSRKRKPPAAVAEPAPLSTESPAPGASAPLAGAALEIAPSKPIAHAFQPALEL